MITFAAPTSSNAPSVQVRITTERPHQMTPTPMAKAAPATKVVSLHARSTIVSTLTVSNVGSRSRCCTKKFTIV
jgi:hypothetical protein